MQPASDASRCARHLRPFRHPHLHPPPNWPFIGLPTDSHRPLTTASVNCMRPKWNRLLASKANTVLFQLALLPTATCVSLVPECTTTFPRAIRGNVSFGLELAGTCLHAKQLSKRSIIEISSGDALSKKCRTEPK